MKELKKITVLNSVIPPESALDFLEWFLGAVELVPREFRHDMKIVFESNGDYDPTVSIYYMRPETDAEMASRLSHEALRKQREELRERLLMRELMDKYGVIL